MTKPTKSKKPAKSKATKITQPAIMTAGATLKQQRLSRGLSLKQIELATRIRGKYLIAIEADKYKSLPHDVYTRGFVRSYAEFVELDPDAIVAQYDSERASESPQLEPQRSRLITPNFTLTPRLITLVGTALAIAAVGGYLAFQLTALTAAPSLSITNPGEDKTLYGSLITVSGHVAGGADVFVNDSPILVDDNGNFSNAIALQDGVNSIRVSAKNRLGKSTVVTRNILAHVPKTDPANVLPTAPFDGVAASVQIQSSAASVTVKADGKQIFQGTMLPGTNQTFKGKESLTISTTNAGATSVTITNAVAANKSLGALGKDNQPKTDFEFHKDTLFQ